MSEEKYLCNSCEHYYDIHLNNMFIGHEFCAKGMCRCCVYEGGDCSSYSFGNVPDGKIAGDYKKIN